MECGEYIEYYGTDGKPVYGWRCYCGRNTACMSTKPVQDYASIQTIELKPEEEAKFYKKAFSTNPAPKREE